MHEHERFGPERVRFGIVVVSDAVYEGRREDVSGKLAKKIITESGHEVTYFSLIPNDKGAILNVLEEAKESPVDVIVFVGGTGLGPNDLTVDVVDRVADKEVPGFGELFRYITFQKRGSIAILTRAGLWVYSKLLILVTPGSPDAVETALQLFLPVARHAVAEARGLRHGMPKGV
ncbi:MogA/MoaB family molybdenum cofactor biosynthesis protein [Ignicoccus hospitalis]|uniref:Molybdenum cofactor synthesis domain n=1 Tax=Ignicoccus hospitalis (strain KIN4/I / DSM 18386 / JCM 14125) TaxID=453591 RepID=A8A8E3_IGNH4|nr:MogA/MoaB family molybdenum cofactor biosynthesis protein [Ignicoccus hospitalis]ABU81195.1 molybdenum cofactor synthesis domain [Ignicoccus hospitalis KIN4/I]HIH90625.1 MogA/MoaB family molybdenum cofactor biosynthesis protein [Desulfurococcaceae archaeon]